VGNPLSEQDSPPREKRGKLVAIAGPTGSGKSEMALMVARRFGGEIINCDSVQVYRYFDIGTAKVPERDREGIPHHLMDVLDPDQVFTAGDFARAARVILHEITGRGRLPIVTGGTGFYLRALIDGLAPGPGRDEALRARLSQRERKRPGSVHRLLRRFDAETAARIHPNDLPKTIRAVEICMAARRPAAKIFAEGRDRLEGFEVLKLGLFPHREALYQRLEGRLERMFDSGIIAETQAILGRGFSEDAKPFESIGYRQALQVIRGELSVSQAIFHARMETRRYAKRQMTWFRREPGLETFRGFGDEPQVQAAVMERVRGFVGEPEAGSVAQGHVLRAPVETIVSADGGLERTGCTPPAVPPGR
jgi:tRNA dimethylallyltransferase